MPSNIPTDNLYKAITVFALLAIGLMANSYLNNPNSIYEAQIRYQEKYIQLEISGANETSLAEYKELTDKAIMSRKAWNDNSNVAMFLITIILLIAFGYGLAGWSHAQNRQDRITDQSINE